MAPSSETAERAPVRPGGWLETAAYLVIVIAGMRAAQGWIVEVLLALLLAFVFRWPVRALERRGCPEWLANIGATLVVLGLCVGLVSALTVSVEAFQGRSGEFAAAFKARFDPLLEALPGATRERVQDVLNPERLVEFVAGAANGLLSALSSLFVIPLIMVFMLTEARTLPTKLALAFGHRDLDVFARVGSSVNEYLFLKAVVSVLTGGLAAALCASVGLDFAVLLGVIAFLFNFVPTIGSIIAAVPALLLAIGQGDDFTAFWLVLLGYALINVVLGNIVEPKLMGRQMGLSTLVVMLSLVFWGWVLGPVGMLLSIPLTMAIKIAMEQSERYRTKAVLLQPCGAVSDSRPPPP